LGLIILGSTLGSLPVQIGLLFTYPWLGIPLLVSGGLTIAAIVIVLVWIIVYALNFVLAEDPAFRRIRDEFLSPDAKAVLLDIQKEVEGSGADLEKIRTVVEEQLQERGAKGNPKKLDKMLTRFERRLSPKVARVSEKVARKSQRAANAEHKSPAP
jgi:hypothetical protein